MRLKWKDLKYISLCPLRPTYSNTEDKPFKKWWSFPTRAETLTEGPFAAPAPECALLWFMVSQQLDAIIHIDWQSAAKRPRGLPCPCALIEPLKFKVVARDTWDCSSHRERPYKDQSLSVPCPLSGPPWHLLWWGRDGSRQEHGQEHGQDKRWAGQEQTTLCVCPHIMELGEHSFKRKKFHVKWQNSVKGCFWNSCSCLVNLLQHNLKQPANVSSPHSLSHISARPCLSNISFCMALSFSNKNSPKLVLGTMVLPFTKKIPVYPFSQQSPAPTCVCPKTLHCRAVSPWKTGQERWLLFLKLWSTPF